LETVAYYQLADPKTRFSFRQRLKKPKKTFSKQSAKLVEIVAFCLMPNHFHLLLKQLKKKGISTFMAQISNSYTRYFNLKYDRVGPLFQGVFKAVRVKNDEQLLHLSRYIHLNPVTDYLVENPEEYLYSSYLEYLKKPKLVSPEIVLGQFASKADYEKFVLNQKDYARKLKEIKRLAIDFG
jgi:putative transposase